MIETEEVVVQNTKITHKFYCDNCKKYLGESTEYDDGYYDSYGDFKYSFFIDGNWYTKHNHYCKDCTKIEKEKLISSLKELGFTKNE